MIDEIKANVASNLIKLRAAAGMTQFELGEKLCYSDKAISKWERAESLPDVSVLKKIADMFGVTVDYLISFHDQWEPKPKKAKKELKFRPKAVMLVTLAGIITLAMLLFVIFWILGSIQWHIFVYALPAALITTLVLNCVWNSGKGNVYIVSALVLSLIAMVYAIIYAACHMNVWQLFLVAIPAEFVVVLCFHVKKKGKKD